MRKCNIYIKNNIWFV